MKEVILNMKAFYISLFVVLFFPLWLMGQEVATTLKARDFLYIQDEAGNVMIATNATTLGVQTTTTGDALLWQVVTGNNNLYFQNCKYKSYLQLNGDEYVLTTDFSQATPIMHRNDNWYLGSEKADDVEASVSYSIKIAVEKTGLFGIKYLDWSVSQKSVEIKLSGVTFYCRPFYSNGKWVVSKNEGKRKLSVSDESVRNAIIRAEGNIFGIEISIPIVKGQTDLMEETIVLNGDYYESIITGDNPSVATKAYILTDFQFSHRPDEDRQEVHEFHEVIYAANKSNGAYGDYGTKNLSLPVDGLTNSSATSLEEWLENLGSTLEEVLTNPYYLSGFYRWYNYDTDGYVSLTHTGYSSNIWGNLPVSYKKTDKGDISLLDVNPGVTTYKIPADFGPDSEPIKIACDVSNYDDYSMSVTSEGKIEITEPTLSYRVIYEIRHADEMRKKVDACTGDKYLETYTIMAPAGQSIKIGPQYACNGNASNYYMTFQQNGTIYLCNSIKWRRGSTVLDRVSYDDNRLITITAPDAGKSVTYTLRDAIYNYNIAKFIVKGYDPTIVGPSATILQKENFYEADAPEFDLKVELDFDDFYDPNSQNNPTMYPNPLPWEDISAGFVYPTKMNYKQREPSFVAMSEYALLSTTEGEGYTKRGSTLPLITNHGEDLPDGEKGKGYFLYVDATKKPSKVADLTINGDLCPNSKMYVSAWIANAYNKKSNETSNYPNLNFVMMGVMTGDNGNIISETPVATFTTGEITTEGKWMHIMFEFATTNVEYDKYRIRIENNNAAVFGTGNDFAIDDIKIYMTSRTEASITQNRSCPAWNPTNSDLNKSNVAILRADIVDVPDGDIYMNYTWLKQIGESADGNDVDVELLDLKNYIDVTANAVDPNKIFGKIKVNKAWIENISLGEQELKKEVTIGSDNIVIYKNTEAFFADPDNDFSDDLEASAYFFTIEGEGDDERIVLYIVHKSSLFQQFEEYCSIVTPINLDNYISEYKTKYADSNPDDEDALEALYNELKCGTRSKFEVLPYASIMLSKDGSNNYDFDFTQAVVKHLAKGQDYTFAVEAYYEGTEIKDDKTVKVMKPYNCYADWLLVTNDKTKWEDAQKIIEWRDKGGAQPTLSQGNTNTNTLMTPDNSVTSFQVANFSGPLHYIAIPDPKAVDVDGDGDGDHTPCAIPVEIYLYDSIPATLANPEVSEATDTWNYDRPAAICNEPIIVRIPNSLEGKGNISLNLNIDYFDEYLFAEIAKYNAQEGNVNPDPWNNIYLYEYDDDDENKQLVPTSINFNIKDKNNQTLTLDLLNKDDAVTISGGHTFASGQKYHFAGHNVVNGVKITPPFQFDVYVVPDEVVWTGDKGTAWHNDANWNPAFVPLSATNVRIPNTTNKPVLNPSENVFEEGANELLKHDIVTLNSCKDIYFAEGAQLANQHMLNYERAFVDVPFTNDSTFKIMSFPLRNVYRGDLYIPKAGDGTFYFANSVADVDNRASNSFYVKAYDSAIKQNHVVDNKVESSPDEYNYENTSWSNPTSVLNFKFEEAHGYAVSFDTTTTAITVQSFVRLPKSATEYYLFMDFGEGNEIELKGLGSTWPTYEISEFQLDKDGKRIRSSEGHKLVYDKSHGASVTFENKKGNIFLIGNPFMTGLDVKAFLENEENKNSLEHKFYYQYDKGSIDAKMVDHHDTCTCVIPPFGAMFVKGKTDDVKQTFKFTPEMMSYKQSPEPPTQQRAPRMVEERELLTITAEVDGARSRTYIEKDFAANNEYLDTEDADLLVLDADLTPISVYSVATGAALAYNSVTDMEFVPLGLLLVDSTIVAESVRFTFDGVDYFYDELYLYDALYNSYLPLIDGVALELEMPESGELRYFITDTKHNVGGGVATSDDLVEGSKVCVFTTEGEACIIAEDIISEATVYDIAGRLIYYSDQISSSQHNISLPNGVYMLKVVVNSNLSTHKIILK